LFEAAELLASEIIAPGSRGIVAWVQEPQLAAIDDAMDRLGGLIVRRLIADVRDQIETRRGVSVS
jgi:hypothetical protein